MASLDALSEAIRSSLDLVRHLATSIAASRDQAAEVRDRLAALGVERGSTQIHTSVQRIEEGQAQAGAIADRLASALAAVDAARAGAGGASGGGGQPPSARTAASGPAASTEPTRVGKRHLLNRIGLNSPAKEKNTVVLPRVDTDRDIAAIKSGHARHLRDNLYEVNDRIYGLETPSGTVYPVKGDGFVAMDKLQFTALKGLVAYNGDRGAAEQDPKIARFRRHMTDETWEHARRVFEQGQGRA
ncbi:hypothetical protein [Glycomyces rhizosphaerae]|uniref:Uncharacterized protein n=1 Tax=Glycomyces rhizosphaerae TaxID=2054422 RepID=A0ABV7Q998_9ACTN